MDKLTLTDEDMQLIIKTLLIYESDYYKIEKDVDAVITIRHKLEELVNDNNHSQLTLRTTN